MVGNITNTIDPSTDDNINELEKAKFLNFMSHFY